MRLALADGLKMTVVLGGIVTALVFVLVFALGNFSGTLLGGSLPIPSPAASVRSVGLGSALLGALLTARSVFVARNPVVVRSVHRTSQIEEVRHWRDYDRGDT